MAFKSLSLRALSQSFLARGAAGSLGIRIATVGLAFVTQILLARFMGAGPYGTYIYVLTWLNVLALLSRCGLDNLLIRFAAAYAARRQWSLLKGLIRFAYRLAFLASLGLGLLVWLLIELMRNEIGGESYRTFLAALVVLPISALWGVGQGLLFGLKHPWRAQLPEPISRIVLIFSAAALYGYAGHLSAPAVMVCGAASVALGLVIGTLWLQRAIPPHTRVVHPASAARDWVSAAVPLLLTALMRMLLAQSDILLVGYLLDDTRAAGIYAAATRLAELTTFGLQAVNTTLGPMISELYATQQKARLQSLLTSSARGILAFTVMVNLVLAGFGKYILNLFGPDFLAAYEPLLILLAGQTINAATGSVGNLMAMTGYQRQTAWFVGIGAALAIALDLLLIPRFGLDGAAVASATGTSVLNLAMLVFVASRLKLNSTVFRRSRYGKA